MDKIDFFGGCHGNFLEVMLEIFVYGNKSIQDKSLFNQNGAAHLKQDISDYSPSIRCGHYSNLNQIFDEDDRVIEIHCCEQYKLAALTNWLLRAGDEKIDLNNLHLDTISKLKGVSKAYLDLRNLIDEHGVKQNYPKQVLRNYFYSKFQYDDYGISLWNNFKHKGKTHRFPLSAFYDLDQFYFHLNSCAYFLNLNFYPTTKTATIWNEFIEQNQGYHSQIRCNKIVRAILDSVAMEIENLNLIEEAYIVHRIAMLFRCYDHPLLTGEYFPTNTVEIANAIYWWKSKDFKDEES